MPAASVTLRPAVPHRETEVGLPKRDINPFTILTKPAIRMGGMVLAFCVLLVSADALAALHKADVERGSRMFRICAGCHSLKAGEFRVGPPLAGLIGRKAGAVPGFRYSKALRQSGFFWNTANLDAWLANPKKYVPGSRMPFSGIRNDQARAALIAFLENATREKP